MESATLRFHVSASRSVRMMKRLSSKNGNNSRTACNLAGFAFGCVVLLSGMDELAELMLD